MATKSKQAHDKALILHTNLGFISTTAKSQPRMGIMTEDTNLTNCSREEVEREQTRNIQA